MAASSRLSLQIKLNEVDSMAGKDLDKNSLIQKINVIFHETEGNFVTSSMTADPDLIGIPLFDEPLIGLASATDPLFQKYKEKDVIGPWFMTPEEWMPGAGTVISIFLPFSDAVKKSNHGHIEIPSLLWLFGRIEGQEFIASFAGALRDALTQQTIPTCVPGIDPRFRFIKAGKGLEGFSDMTEKTFGSNWSERHAAYAAGLGTFGLSKGLITRRGIAGRFTSIIISERLDPDPRPYTGLYDYCIMCGACIRRCPANAISIESGKDHAKCFPWLLKTGEMHTPRFGCGKCQTAVPCESGIPAATAKERD